MAESVTKLYLPLTTLITYSLVLTLVVKDLTLTSVLTSVPLITSYFLSRKYFTLVLKGLAVFIGIYVATSLTTQYVVTKSLSIEYVLTNSLRILGITYLALTTLRFVSDYLVINYLRRGSVTSIITQLVVATNSLRNVLETTPELLFVVRNNYGLVGGLKGFIKSYVAVAKVATLNTLLRVIQYYESLITRLPKQYRTN